VALNSTAQKRYFRFLLRFVISIGLQMNGFNAAISDFYVANYMLQTFKVLRNSNTNSGFSKESFFELNFNQKSAVMDNNLN
jgi:hypothetical protein